MATTTTPNDLKQRLADALRMMERAEVIDFNGHMSCRLPGTGHVLIVGSPGTELEFAL